MKIEIGSFMKNLLNKRLTLKNHNYENLSLHQKSKTEEYKSRVKPMLLTQSVINNINRMQQPIWVDLVSLEKEIYYLMKTVILPKIEEFEQKTLTIKSLNERVKLAFKEQYQLMKEQLRLILDSDNTVGIITWLESHDVIDTELVNKNIFIDKKNLKFLHSNIFSLTVLKKDPKKDGNQLSGIPSLIFRPFRREDQFIKYNWKCEGNVYVFPTILLTNLNKEFKSEFQYLQNKYDN